MTSDASKFQVEAVNLPQILRRWCAAVHILFYGVRIAFEKFIPPLEQRGIG
jgi:hypothetical protein